MPMTEDQAKAEAAKREKNKSKHMTNKLWRAQHTEEKGWHVALVDNPHHVIKEGHKEAHAIFHGGGTVGQFKAVCDRMFSAQMEIMKESLDKN